jgi:hypothetical protein
LQRDMPLQLGHGAHRAVGHTAHVSFGYWVAQPVRTKPAASVAIAKPFIIDFPLYLS